MPGAPSNQPCLTVLGGPMSGTQFDLEDAVDNILIGADSSCKFCIPLPGVSPIHARIWLDAGGATVYDTHSPRGLYVNDDRVNGEAPLKNGDILWLGTPGEQDVVMIQCRLPRAVPAPEPPPPLPSPDEPAVQAEDEVPGATLVMAAEPGLTAPVAPPPDASEFYVAVEDESPAATDLYEMAPPVPDAAPEPETPSIGATTVLDGPDLDEAYLLPPEEPPAPTPIPVPIPPPPAFPVLETEFEDETTSPEPPPREPETIVVVPAPTPVPPPPVPAKAEPPVSAPRPPAPRPTAAPKPAPSAPRPAPAAPRPAPSAAPVARAAPPSASSPMRGIVLALVALAVLAAGGGFLLWRSRRPTSVAVVSPTPAPAPTTLRAAPTPEPSPPPVVETPAPPPPVEEVVTIVKSPSPKAPSPSPSPGKPSPSPKGPTPAPAATPAGPSPEEQRTQAAAAQVAGLLAQADAATARPEEALRLYDEVLKLDPQNARGAAGKAASQGAAAASRKRFAPGRTSILSAKARTDVSGFESADVQVADAPGRIDFEATPLGVKPGDSFAVKIYFANESKKAIKVKSLSVSTTANGARSGGPATPQAREIGPGQRALIGEVSGAWKDGTTSWSTDVVMVSERNDSYRNQVSWR